MARRRLRRAAAGQQILTITHELMDGLLADEATCFEAIEDQTATLAEAIGSQLQRIRTQAGLVQGARGIVAGMVDLRPRFEPPVGDLMAVTRERTLVVVEQQLELCAATLSVRADDLVAAGRRSARGVVVDLERYWLGRYGDALAAATVRLRADMAQQLRVWQASGEEKDLLVRRWCSPVQVVLPGAQARGSVFMLRSPLAAAARATSVAVMNGLLLAGLQGWNRAAESA